jgi:hypothetical protein
MSGDNLFQLYPLKKKCPTSNEDNNKENDYNNYENEDDVWSHVPPK